MRHRLIVGLLFLASLVTPLAAHADTFLYTVEWHASDPVVPQFVGTDSFTVDHLLLGNVYVYGPDRTPIFWPGYEYVYTSDFNTSPGSKIAALQFEIFPDFISPVDNQLWPLYCVGAQASVDASGFGPYILASVRQDPLDPYSFYSEVMSFHITRLSDTSPVPEPSTLLLLGTGGLGIATRLRRRT